MQQTTSSIFMYGNSNHRPLGGAAAGPSSSLMLQQHLVHHYRHLQNVRPAVDSGQVTRNKSSATRGPPQRPWRRQRAAEERCRAPSSDSTPTLQLVERILNDVHLPPQCYTGHLAPDCSDKSLDLPDDAPGRLRPLVASPELVAADGEPPTDDESILDKIDSYLSAVRAERQRHVVRRRRSGPPSPVRRRPAARPCQQRSPAGRRQRLPRSLAAQRQLQSQILRAHLSPASKYLPGRRAGSVGSSGRWPPDNQHQYQQLQQEKPLSCGRSASRLDSGRTTLCRGSVGRVPALSISPDSDQDGWSGGLSCPTPRTGRSQRQPTSDDRPPSKLSSYSGADSGRSLRPANAGIDRPGGTFRCDDQAYVQFLGGVTADILARGAFTNRLLKQVMMAHLERSRDRLDTGRMLAELDRLRQELGVPAEPELDDAQFGYGCKREPPTPPLPPPLLPLSPLPSVTAPASSRRSHTTLSPVPVAFLSAAPPTVATILPAEEPPAGRLEPPCAEKKPGLSVGGTAAPRSGRAVDVVRLLSELSLDESTTRTVLRCCGDGAELGPDVSVTSDELRRCLDGGRSPRHVA